MCERRVSYIITTRNRAEFLDRTLANVREFMTPEDELIVRDGGSIDTTAQVVEKYGDMVTLFRSEPDCGEGHGFNKGILASRGRYIKIVTDDDYFYPEAMHRAVSVLEENPDLDAVLCGGEAYRFDPASGKTALVAYRWIPPSCRLAANIYNVHLHTVCGIGLWLRRRVLARVGLFDTSYRAIDLEYITRCIARGIAVKYLHIKLFRHIEYPHSGQGRQAEMDRDALRTLLANSAWQEMIERGRYDPAAVGTVLGVSGLRRGEALLQAIWYAERLRRSRLHPLLSTGMWCLAAPVRMQRFVGRVLGSVRGRSRQRAPHSEPPAEPSWDGSLR